MAKYSTLTDADKNRYWETYYGTRDTLRFAIIDLAVAADEAKWSSDSSAILAEKLRLESELARLQNHSTAVAADDDAIAAPSAADVAKVKALADQVDGLTVTANTYAKAVDAADDALKTYNKVRG